MKTIKKLLISLAVLVFLLGVASAFLFAGMPKQNGLESNHSFTKAICDEKNYCEDYFVNCLGKRLLEIKSTGYAVQFSENWKDLRDGETKEKLC